MNLDLTDYRRLTGALYERPEAPDWVPWDELDEGKWKKSKFQNPADWKKPEHYPGFTSPEHKKALGKGYLDLGLLDPHEVKGLGRESKLAARVRKHILQLLMKTKGKMAFVRDPEGILKMLYKGKMVKNALADDLHDATSAMFGQGVEVAMKMVTGKSGLGWKMAAPELGKLMQAAEAAELDEKLGTLKGRLSHAKDMFGKARQRQDRKAMHWWKSVYKHTKKALKGDEKPAKGAGGGGAGAGAAEPPKDDHGGHEQSFLKALGSKGKGVVQAFKNLPKNSKKFFSDPGYRKEVAKAAGKSIRAKAAHAVQHVKDEAHEFKTAGIAIGKAARGKEISDHEKHAIKAAAKTVAMTVIGTVAMGGIAHLTLGALAGHFAAETAIKAVVRAAVLAHLMQHGIPYLTEEEVDEKALEAWTKKLVDHIAKEFENLADASPEEMAALLMKIQNGSEEE